MPWAKIDDGFHNHPKVLRAGLSAVGLHCLCLSYCARHLTDGFVPVEFVSGRRVHAQRLVGVGLWSEVDGGYEIHDYLKYNPSRVEIETDRERVRNWKRTRAEQRENERGRVSHTQPIPIPKEKDQKKVQYAPSGFIVPDPILANWVQAYPDVDVLGEVRRAHAWTVANPDKPKKNWSRFLVNWLADKQGKTPKPAAPPDRVRPALLDESPPVVDEQVSAEGLARIRDLMNSSPVKALPS